jgi:hypothetical protein
MQLIKNISLRIHNLDLKHQHRKPKIFLKYSNSLTPSFKFAATLFLKIKLSKLHPYHFSKIFHSKITYL